jgi:hypothetical protein
VQSDQNSNEMLEKKRNREGESNLSSLSDLFILHKLNMPNTLTPEQNSTNPIQNYLLPNNLNPIVTNSASLNTAKPSYMNISNTSLEMDWKIKGNI